eukprot:Lithocolla_globosa_v1_NODE_5191_length_1285_cov_788.617886.p2 type:complete len:162 gc:universal NODE_5191_length_1285_cov_788.617886:884-399(-)
MPISSLCWSATRAICATFVPFLPKKQSNLPLTMDSCLLKHLLSMRAMWNWPSKKFLQKFIGLSQVRTLRTSLKGQLYPMGVLLFDRQPTMPTNRRSLDVAEEVPSKENLLLPPSSLTGKASKQTNKKKKRCECFFFPPQYAQPKQFSKSKLRRWVVLTCFF